jgi:hypothetical protein
VEEVYLSIINFIRTNVESQCGGGGGGSSSSSRRRRRSVEGVKDPL